MTAWSVLVSNSTLPDNGVNTAWDHLNNQNGGGGPGGYILGPVSAEVINVLSSNVDPIELSANVVTTLSTSIETEHLSAIVTTTSADID